MPFEPGNQYGKGNAKAQKLTGVIERAILQDDGKRLRNGVERLLDLASEGDLAAMTFIRDTWQGKPQQSVTISGDADAPMITAIKMILIDANSLNNNEKEIAAQVIENDSQLEIVETNSQSSEVVPPLPPSVILGDPPPLV